MTKYFKSNEVLNRKENLIAFAPYAFIWQHSIPEAIVLRALEGVASMTYVYCKGVLNGHCTSMSAAGIKPNAGHSEKQPICNQCRARAQRIFMAAPFNYIAIEDLISEPELLEIESLIDAGELADLQALVYKHVPVGKIAMYEVILENKKNSLVFSNQEFEHYKHNLRNALISVCAISKLFKKQSYARLITYNTLYATNHAAYAVANNHGAVTYCLHAGMNWSNRLQRMIVTRDTTFVYEDEIVRHYPRYKDMPLTRTEINDIAAHFRHIFESKSVFNYSASYKSNISIRDKFGIRADQKILVASLSSFDERFAYQVVGQRETQHIGPFTDQVAWIKWLIEYIQDRESLFLIIRVHPREFPNKRYQSLSENVQRMQRAFVDLPANAVINWPDDQLSIYNLAEQADALLNAHSSACLDFLLYGRPVVIYDPALQTFPIDLFYYKGPTASEYAMAIELALKGGSSFENTVKMFRWLNLKLKTSEFDISDRVKIAKSSLMQILFRFVGKIGKTRVRVGEFLFTIRPPKQSLDIAKLVISGNSTRLDIQPSTHSKKRSPTTERRQLLRQLRALGVPST